MSKPEASLWDYLRTVLPIPKAHYSRIESDTSPGFPDIHYSLLGFSGTIELKVGNPKAKMPFLKSGLRKTQLDWMEEEDKANGVIWIIAQVDKVIFLIDGNTHFEEFNRMTTEDLHRVCDYSWVRGEDIPTDELWNYLAETR